jgi:hypothetical protein
MDFYDPVVLERWALENYFSDRAIKAYKGEAHRGLGPFERLKDATPRWSKAENWLIARQMTRPEIECTDLGMFLASV